MKRITLFALAAMVFAASSCSKPEITDGVTNGTTPETDGNLNSGELLDLTFGVATEVISKTSINGSVAEWVEGDKVKVIYDGGHTETYAQTSGTSVSFTVGVTERLSELFFSYPYDTAANLDSETLTLTLPAVQDGSFSNVNYMIAKADVEDETVMFYHAGSVFKVIVEDETITKAVITGNGGEALTGSVPFSFEESGITFGEPSETGTELTINISGTGTYYASALPGLTLSEGATIRFFRGDVPAGGNCISTEIPVSRAKIASFGKDVEMCNRYVSATADGTGNGRTPASSWSTEQFVGFMQGSAYSKEKYAALDGVNIHLASGTYFVSNIDVNIPGSNVTITVEGESKDDTFLDGNSANPILHNNRGGQANTTLVFKNITFQNGYRETDHGGAAYFAYGTTKFENCKFYKNESGKYGGAFNMYSSAVVELTDCEFSENSAENAGVFYLSGSALAKLTDCVFTGNTATTDGGAVKVEAGTFEMSGGGFYSNTAANGGALAITKQSVTLNGVEFKQNKATKEQGGAIRIWGNASADVKVNGCKFIENETNTVGGAIYHRCGSLTIGKYNGVETLFRGNTSKGDGGAIYAGNDDNQSTLEVSGACFEENSASSKGGAVSIVKNSSIKADDCLFADNVGSQGGAIAAQNASNSIFLNDCVFSGNHSTSNYGTTIALPTNGGTTTLCMNNCSFADNTYSASGNGQQSCWINLKGLAQLVMSNSTLIGVTRNANGPATETYPNLLRFDGNKGTGNALINNIIAPTDTKCYAIDAQSSSVSAKYNKTASVRSSDNYLGVSDANDVYGTSEYFGALSWTAASAPKWDNCFWGWNGTLAKGSNTSKAQLVDVQNAIKDANSDFYSWLNSIGALDKDCRGKQRGTTTWPGAYDGTNL